MTIAPLAIDIARAVRDAGGRALVVGGWVRDRARGLDPKDLDIEVFGIPAAALRALLERFGRVDAVGESFTVYKVAGIDVSLPRRESKTGRGHRGFTVEGDPLLSVADAARRRDFTINAMAWDPLSGETLDPCDGEADLRDGRLRAVDPSTFGDDSLRVLRALQFAARFDLTLDADTRDLCRALPLDDLPAERIWGEMEKLLLRAPRPSLGLALALDLGVVDRLWPELKALVGCEQEPEWHPEGDVWVHTLMVVDQARTRLDGLDHPRAVVMMLGALCHDMGKPATTRLEDGRIRSRGHEEAGVAPATTFLDRLNIHSLDGYDVRRTVLGIVAHHLKPSMFFKAPTPVGDGAFRRLAQKVDLDLLARFARADCHGRTGTFDCTAMDWFQERARALGVEHQPPAPLLLGRHVLAEGLAPGPRVGELLSAVYEQQLDGHVTTLDEALAALRRLL
jgi:tRNA nucleotidyltransferase (CCA-adding enzyme)